MKAMKAASTGVMTATQAYGSVAETCGLKAKDVKAIIDGIDRRSRPVEEDWFLQAWWRVELEAQEETCPTCSQGCQPVHQGAMRVQGEASEQNCQGFPNEETQGDDQLRWF